MILPFRTTVHNCDVRHKHFGSWKIKNKCENTL